MLDTFIAHYKITGKLGAGGMGEVYRATDTKLDRDVAIKILPQGIRDDSKRMARFQREAKALASLNHPHIGGIYGVEDSDLGSALILEFLEGESLSARLLRGPMPIDEAIETSQQIAAALQAAHERGIIHRDLKPANVHFAKDSTVKVLDFGLAKSLDAPGASPESEYVSESIPTMTADATQPGAVIGTAGYMSPEQARGISVDQRTDVWAFGCCLYEMLTGVRLFRGETITDRIAEVLKVDPDWSTIPEETPESVRTLLRRCLEKDHRRRLSSAGDIAILLQEIGTTTRLQNHTSAPEVPPRQEPKSTETDPLASGVSWWWKFAALSSILLLIGVTGVLIQRTVSPDDANIPSTAPIRSLAILPFDDLKPDEEYGWLSDAMADAIRDKLGGLDGITVRRGHTTLKEFTNRGQSVSDAAQTLNVNALVQGNFVHHQGTLRLNVSLYDGESEVDTPLGQFSNDASAVFELQNELALAIATRLRRNLNDEELDQLAKNQGVPLAAYQAFRKGTQVFDLYTLEGFEQAEQYFREALRLDPGYGNALAGFASLPWVRTIWGGTTSTPQQGAIESRSILATHSASIRNKAELQGIEGWLAFCADWNWALGEKHMRQAAESSHPTEAAVQRAKTLSIVEGRYYEALDLINSSLEVEPDRFSFLDGKSDVLLASGNYQKALKVCQTLLKQYPEHWDAHIAASRVYAGMGRWPEAVSAAVTAYRLSNNNPFCLASRALAYAQAGSTELARKDLATLEALSEQLYIDKVPLADVYAELGEWDQAFESLRSAVAQQGGWGVLNLRLFERLERFGGDERYWELINELKFPPLPIYHPKYELEQRMRFGGKNDTNASTIRSIAILPFDDLKPDEEFGWLSDAMADAIRVKLSGVKGIVVKRARMQLKEITSNNRSLTDVARSLSVDALVLGNFVHHQSELRLNVSLHHATEEQDLPLGQFNSTSAKVFELQNQVALAIAEKVQKNLNENERMTIARSRGIDPAAYEAYRKGLKGYLRYLYEGFDEAEIHFKRAIALDPGYGEPIMRLGQMHWLRTLWGGSVATPYEGITKARAVIEKHADKVREPESLRRLEGWIALIGDRDWVKSEKLLRQNWEWSHRSDQGSYARYLNWIEGRYQEAIDLFEQELEAEPNRIDLLFTLSQCYLMAGHTPEALRISKVATEMDPKYWPTLITRTRCLINNNQAGEALEMAEQAVQFSNEHPFCLTMRAYALASLGEIEQARSELTRVEATAEPVYVDQAWLAFVEIALGNTDGAIRRLKTAATAKGGWGILQLRTSRFIDALGNDPRYWEIVNDLNFPPLPVYHPYHEIEQRSR